MHFEILMEDQSGAEAMKVLLPKILTGGHTYKIHPFKGIGHLPKDLNPRRDIKKQLLLNLLPALLAGYGRSARTQTVVMICDLDDRNKKEFISELNQVLDACDPRPRAMFCLAVEEIEAWYLGDLNAVRKAYPDAREWVLNQYVNDSICGTWEMLADAVSEGGHRALKKKGYRTVGLHKSIWARTITPHMNVEHNRSESFHYLFAQLRRAAALYKEEDNYETLSDWS